MAERAVFLDRDGVLCVPEFRDGRSFAPRTLAGFKLYPDAEAATARLKTLGFLVVVVTNQPDVAHGLIARDVVEDMHRALIAGAAVDRIETCYHAQTEGCDCRKPKPGMLLRAAAALHVDPGASYMVGDRASDVVAGRAAGCRTVFIDLDYEAEPRPERPDAVVRSLSEAVDWIVDDMDHQQRRHSCRH